MLGVGEPLFNPLNESERIGAERRNAGRRLLGLATGFKGIVAARHRGSRFVSKVASHRERYSLEGRAKAHLPQLAVAPINECPLFRTTGPDSEVKPVAVGIAARLLCGFDRPRRQKVLLAVPSGGHRLALTCPNICPN